MLAAREPAVMNSCHAFSSMLTFIQLRFNKKLASNVYVDNIGSAMPLPDNLRRVRLGQFLSQAEFGRRSGVHALTITRWADAREGPRGVRHNHSKVEIARLSHVNYR
jgi:hypothetical protein